MLDVPNRPAGDVTVGQPQRRERTRSGPARLPAGDGARGEAGEDRNERCGPGGRQRRQPAQPPKGRIAHVRGRVSACSHTPSASGPNETAMNRVFRPG